MADRPPYYSTDPPETTTSLEQFLILPADCPATLGGLSAVHIFNPAETSTSLDKILNSTADCPAPLGGPSAVHVFNPPETTASLDKILDSTADCPRPSGGSSAVQSCETHQRQHRLWTNFELYGGLSALQWQTVRSSTLRNPPETTSSLDKSRTLRRTVRSPTADRPQFNSAKPSETTTSLDNF